MTFAKMNKKHKSKEIIIVGIMFLICFLVGSNNVADKFHITRYIAISLCLSAMYLYSVFTSKKMAVPNTKCFYVALVFMILSGISMIWATDFGESVFAFSKYVITFLTALVFYNLLRENHNATKKMIYLASCVILVVYLSVTVIQLFDIQNSSFEQLYNVTGISGHKNMLSLMFFILSAFSLASLTEQKKKALRILTLALCVIALTTIIILKSRAVILSAIVAAVFLGTMLLLRKRKFVFSEKAKSISIFVSFVALLLFFTIGLRAFSRKSVPLTSQKSEIEYNVLSTSSLSERCLLWDKTYRIIDNHPITGCGIGNWQIEFPNSGLKGLYRADLWNVNFTRPHNEFLDIFSECGYVTFAVYLFFLCSLIILSFSSICKTKNFGDFVFGAVTLSVFVAYCVNSFFDFPSSRIEGVAWLGVLFAILFHFISRENGESRQINKSWGFLLLFMSVFFVVIGFLRFESEKNLVDIQKARDRGNWEKVEKLASESISVFYTIDPSGMPMHWHLGKAQNYLGKRMSVDNLRKAYKHAPYCKENLNDLGLTEYFVNKDVENAEFYLKEAIRISPNYLYPSFNLASIYMNERKYSEAKEVIDNIYMDEKKRDALIGDIVFFEPNNVESTRKDIEEQYEAAVQIRMEIDSLLKK